MSALVGVIMGSKSDWPTMKYAVEMLEELGVHMKSKWCLHIAHLTKCLITLPAHSLEV